MKNSEHNQNCDAQTADCWTNSTATMEAITSFASMLFFVARGVDSIADFEESCAGISYYGLACGVIVAIFCTAGSTYCHRILNMLNQHDEHSNPTLVRNVAVVIEDQLDDNHADTASFVKNNEPSALTCKQKILLLGDLLGHSAETAAPLAFMIALAVHMNRWEKLAANAACLIAGLFGSAANVRTCYQALKKKNAMSNCVL